MDLIFIFNKNPTQEQNGDTDTCVKIYLGRFFLSLQHKMQKDMTKIYWQKLHKI